MCEGRGGGGYIWNSVGALDWDWRIYTVWNEVISELPRKE